MSRIFTRLIGIRTQRLLGRRYRADRWATVVALILVVLAVPVAVVTSATNYGAETAAEREKAASLYETVAVLQEDAVAPDSQPGTYAVPVQVPATWRTRDGLEHEGQITVQPQLAVGTEVPVWVDADGRLAAAPKTQTEITTTVIATGVWNLALMELAILGGYWLVLWLIDRTRMASWGAEWAQVEPRWSKRR